MDAGKVLPRCQGKVLLLDERFRKQQHEPPDREAEGFSVACRRLRQAPLQARPYTSTERIFRTIDDPFDCSRIVVEIPLHSIAVRANRCRLLTPFAAGIEQDWNAARRGLSSVDAATGVSRDLSRRRTAGGSCFPDRDFTGSMSRMSFGASFQQPHLSFPSPADVADAVSNEERTCGIRCLCSVFSLPRSW